MTLIIAHRGFSGNYPENTMLAFRKAVELGVDWIELDVRLSLDHKLIILHDHKMNRTTNGRGRLEKKTSDEINCYHTKKGRQSIPTLRDVFDLVKNSGTKINVEIKNIWAAKPVVDLINECGMINQVIVSSGNILVLRVVKKEMPSVQISWPFFLIPSNMSVSIFGTLLFKISFRLTHHWVLRQAIKTGVDYINLYYLFATKSFINKLHSHGFKVNVWNVNTAPLMRKLIKLGVDGIFTNRPDILKRVLSEKSNNKPISLRTITKNVRFQRIKLKKSVKPVRKN